MAALLLTVPVRWLFGWTIAVIIHELGHYVALEFSKAPVGIVIFGMHGAHMQSRGLSNKETLICAAAGPLLGSTPMLFARFFPAAALCSLLLTLFNLIPVPGHDGDLILQSICHLIWSERTADAVHKGLRTAILTVASGIILFLLIG